MGKQDSAPTLGWVVVSQFNKWIVRICLLVTVCLVVAGATIVARMDADCSDHPRWTFETFGYETDVMFSKTNCPL